MPLLLLPVFWAQLQQPCRIWSVREALSYSGLCEVPFHPIFFRFQV